VENIYFKIYDNVGNPKESYVTINTDAETVGVTRIAQEFTPGSSYNIRDVELYQDSGGSLVGDIRIETDGGGSPSGFLAGLNSYRNGETLNTGSVTTVTLNGATPLSGGTPYWIVFQRSTGSGEFLGGTTGTPDRCKYWDGSVWTPSSDVENIYFTIYDDTATQQENYAASNTDSETVGAARIAQKFTAGSDYNIEYLELYQKTGGSLVGNVRIETDSGGSPSGTLVSAGAYSNGETLNSGSETEIILEGATALDGGTTYWIVFERTSGNGKLLGGTPGTPGRCKFWDGSAWRSSSYVENIYFKIWGVQESYIGTDRDSDTITATDTQVLVTGDLNNDGKTDLVVGYDDAITSVADAVWMGDGDGTFTRIGNPGWSGLTDTRALALGDLDSDGKPDLVVGLDGAADSVWTGDGDGTFTLVTGPGWGVGPTDTRSLTIGDLENDGNPDLIVGIHGSADTVWCGSGDGTFTQAAMPGWNPTNSNSAVLADFDHDGDLDMVSVFTAEEDRYFENTAGTVSGTELGTISAIARARLEADESKYIVEPGCLILVFIDLSDNGITFGRQDRLTVTITPKHGKTTTMSIVAPGNFSDRRIRF